MRSNHPFRRGFSVMFIGFLVCVSHDALAQQPGHAWVPNGPVTIVLPYGTGSGPNATARRIAEKLGQQWKQPVVVENMPGAGGLLGTRKAISARPDGRTLLFQLTSMVLNKHLPGMGGEDPIPQLVPIVGVASSPLLLVAGNHVQGNTLPQVVQGCNTALTPCSIGVVGNMGRIAALQFKAESGLKNLILINYKESTQVVSDMIGGRLSFTILGGSVLAQTRQGMIKAVALTAPKRLGDLPDVQTTAEAGWPNFQYFYWYALFAPKGTPPEAVRSIAAAVGDIVKDPEMAKTAQTFGAEVINAGPEELTRHLEAEMARFDRLIKLYPIIE